ncbi:MAG TPA: glycosyltransferase family 4 protein [Solirubrobacteraceae bacterium]|jgi:glycosyltransferase involved in cell wall biosynthesis
MLVHQPTDGGVGRHVRDIAEGLAERGHEIVLCGPTLPAGIAKPLPRVRHIRLDLGRSIALRTDLSALRSLIRIVRDVKPDVIHAHSSKAGALARLARLLQPQVPVIYTPHGYAFAGYFSRERERRVYRILERALAPLATRVLCVCEAEARLARSIGADSRVRVLHNGIEPPREHHLDARMVDLRQTGPTICALTQLRPGKGIETLLDATPSLLKRHPRLQVAIWGEGSELEELRVRAARMGVVHAVHFLGTSEAPFDVLRAAEVFVHPSLAEAFPYVILEAMSVATATIASDVGGIAEALVDGETGILVAPGDSHALASALSDLLENPARRAAMGLAAQRRVEELFTRSTMIDGLTAVYGEVLPLT